MSYALYGKRTERWYNEDTKKWNEPDRTFRALNAAGVRVNKLEDAFIFYERSDAVDFMNKHTFKPGVKIEIRKVKD